MYHNHKAMKGNLPQSAPFQAPPAQVHSQERERVSQLISANKSNQAVDFAKDVHKRCHNAESEALLLDAYSARLDSLLERKLDRDAAALMDLVRERYPSSRERLRSWESIFAARRGDLSVLLEPLNDLSLPPEKQAAIGASVRRYVVDLRALAECRTLAPEHPLRTAAAALDKVFAAVTSGPVSDETLALPEVSRSSPLAPWKMMLHAITAYYRGDDALTEKCLAAVGPDSAAARLAPALRAMMRQPQPLTPAAALLANQAGGNLDFLSGVLKRLDAALDRKNQPLILQEIRNVVDACRQTEPGLLERLKQHISVRAMLAGAKVERVAAAMGGPSLKNAWFWRLYARACEENKGDPKFIGLACSAWEEFRKHAVREGWFPEKGPETATLYLHMADHLRHLSSEALDDLHGYFERHFDRHADAYRGQPAEIRALMPSRQGANLSFLSPLLILERACEADPCTANFERWLHHARDIEPDTCDRVAERWCAALPNDIGPLLHLMQSAEARNAFQKAFKLMGRAEQIDGLNTEVRRARLRLLVSMAVRHLRENKPKLAEKNLRQIEALPQAQQGDRPAFVAALRYLCCLLGDAKREAASAYDEAVRFLKDAPTAHFLFLAVERWCGRRTSALGDSARPSTPLSAAFGRVCALGEDMGMPVDLFDSMPDILIRELSAPNVSADPRALAALGKLPCGGTIFHWPTSSPAPAWHKVPKPRRLSCFCGHDRCRRGKKSGAPVVSAPPPSWRGATTIPAC
jgi:hypothetical protein